jgi:hypothetical protein
MTDAQKLNTFERMVEIISDALALEKYYAQKGEDWQTIEFVRCDAFKNIVDAAFGPDALHVLENLRHQIRAAKAV